VIEPAATSASASPDQARIVDVINLSSSANTLLRERVLAMRARGVDNRILCIDGPYVERLRGCGIPVDTVAIPRGIDPLRMMGATLEMARHLRRERVDLVHTHCSMPGILARVAARLAGVPVIVHTIHGLAMHDHASATLRGLYNFAEKFCGGFTDMLLSQNRTDLEIARRGGYAPDVRLKLIGNGIDLDRFRPVPRPERRDGPFTLICTARFEPVKNHAMLFEGMKLLGERGVDARLWLVGDGELRPEYEARCRELGIAERVEFLGYRDDVPALLQKSDVSVLTSVKEGIPRALLESMAMELPVVATRVVGTEETVRDGETGFLVEFGDAAAFAERVARLAGDPALCRALGARGREVVEQEFDEKRIVESLATIYRQLLRQKGLPAHAARPQAVER
jgi:glycosyltransferase involved in cell wall biosynthesis